VNRYVEPHGYQHRRWHAGEHLPRHYYTNTYYITDYHRYGLPPPRHGHAWVRVDGDAVLVAITTGVIVSLVDHLFFF